MENLNVQLIQEITPELRLQQINEIPVLQLQHKIGSALIALQGAQLLQWQPHFAAQSLLWLSEAEPFKAGTAIRGGVPVCYPWFNNAGAPAHGWARINLWQLTDYEIGSEKVRLEFAVFSNGTSESRIALAKMQMTFTEQCRLEFTHLGKQPAQAALHSYFNIGDITQTRITGLPTSCFDSLTGQQVSVSSPRIIDQNVDCIYSAESAVSFLEDSVNQRKIRIEHQNASDIVLWNPWHKATGNMTENAYLNMVCVETCRINKLLRQGEKIGVVLSLE